MRPDPPSLRPARGVCLRCGSFKDRAMGSCPACGHRPEGDERLHAWLVSRHHLSDDEMAAAAERIGAGEELRPPPELLDLAERNLYPAGRAVPRPSAPEDPDPLFIDQPLDGETQVLLGLGNVALSPLLGFVTWWSLRDRRPRAAAQALTITAPTALISLTIWAAVWWAAG